MRKLAFVLLMLLSAGSLPKPHRLRMSLVEVRRRLR
jgi:hypothetical protein